MEKIRILIVEPQKEPYVAKIEHTLENMQKIVGGLIEVVELEQDVDLICNEECKMLNMEINRIVTNNVICGTFFVAGQKNGATISLTNKQIEEYKKHFDMKKHQDIIGFLNTYVSESSHLLELNLIGIESWLKKVRYEK